MQLKSIRVKKSTWTEFKYLCPKDLTHDAFLYNLMGLYDLAIALEVEAVIIDGKYKLLYIKKDAPVGDTPKRAAEFEERIKDKLKGLGC